MGMAEDINKAHNIYYVNIFLPQLIDLKNSIKTVI